LRERAVRDGVVVVKAGKEKLEQVVADLVDGSFGGEVAGAVLVEAAAQAAGDAVFIKVNTDEQQEIASQFRIQGIPAFALMRNGKIIAQTSGFQPAARLLAWIRQN